MPTTDTNGATSSNAQTINNAGVPDGGDGDSGGGDVALVDTGSDAAGEDAGDDGSDDAVDDAATQDTDDAGPDDAAPDASDVDGGALEDVAQDAPPDTPQTLPPGERNICGGDTVLFFNGVPAQANSACGVCGDGRLVCDGLHALRCANATAPNVCGGCGLVGGLPGGSCGPCGQGRLLCGEDRTSLVCVGEVERNACGGCAPLAGEPGFTCGEATDGEPGVVACQSLDDALCVGLDQNLCGGEGALEAVPGVPCGVCNQGAWRCDGPEAVVCGDAEAGQNACGGCAPLLGEPGAPCGGCGVWACAPDNPNRVVCDEARNGCGGCQALAFGPGDGCGDGGAYYCASPDLLWCGDEGVNACGGAAALSAQPGAPCGACGDGVVLCATPEATICVGGTEPNACGGCGLLPGNPGEPCGLGHAWNCRADGALTCQRLDSRFGQPAGASCAHDAFCEDLLCLVLDEGAGGEGTCSVACPEGVCPEGTSCALVPAGGGLEVALCLPDAACYDADNDGYGVGPDCLGGDCDQDNPAVNVGQAEACGDGIDNDCDGAVDCFDLDCADDCSELCGDGIDNDNDLQVDCRDPDCRDTPACEEVCDDGVDNNADGAADCDDPQCAEVLACLDFTLEVVSGAGQTAPVDGLLSAALVLRVEAVNDAPVAGVVVDVTPAPGGAVRLPGDVAPRETLTSDALGRISVEVVLGPTPGVQRFVFKARGGNTLEVQMTASAAQDGQVLPLLNAAYLSGTTETPSVALLTRESNVFGMARAPDGSLYYIAGIPQRPERRLRKIDPDGRVTTLAGGVGVVSAEEGVPARDARMNDARRLALDAARGLLYVLDDGWRGRVRVIDVEADVPTVYTVLGGGPTLEEAPAPGDTLPALGVAVWGRDIQVAPDGALHALVTFADASSGLMTVRVQPDSGLVEVLDGEGATCANGVAAPCVASCAPEALPLNPTCRLLLDDEGGAYVGGWIALNTPAVVYAGPRVEGSRVVIGGGATAVAGDVAIAADQARLTRVKAMALDASGHLFVADSDGQSACRVLRVEPRSRRTTRALGADTCGSGGDYGPAPEARVDRIEDMAFDAAGDLFWADLDTHSIRRARGLGQEEAAPIALEVVEPTDLEHWAGDHQGVVSLALRDDQGAALANYPVCFDRATANIQTFTPCVRTDDEGVATFNPVAGLVVESATLAFELPGLPGADTRVELPVEVVPLPNNTAAVWLNRFNALGVSNARVPAAFKAEAAAPGPAVVASDGAVYYASGVANGAVWRITPEGWVERVAGNNGQGGEGDGGPALDAQLSLVRGLALDEARQRLYVAHGPTSSSNSGAVRAIDLNTGTIALFAGVHNGLSLADIPALQVSLRAPGALSVGPDGTVYISDTSDTASDPLSRTLLSVHPDDGIIRRVFGPGLCDDPDAEACVVSCRTNGTPGCLMAWDDEGAAYVTGTVCGTGVGAPCSGSQSRNGVVRWMPGMPATSAQWVLGADGNVFDASRRSGGPRETFPLAVSTGLALDALGRVYVAELINNSGSPVWRFDPETGDVTPLAGQQGSGAAIVPIIPGDPLELLFAITNSLAIMPEGHVLFGLQSTNGQSALGQLRVVWGGAR